ncbi:MAG TPA: SusC/RagA family TonB-linked outer membrane protein, partial [Chitinophagaceae bacterium]|nr:SusC/RagA family TonB-linked outer membrane protein [Chitinophagaceae bacterium]
MKRLLLFLTGFFSCMALFAQRSVSGRVTDLNGIPLQNASVTVKETGAGVSTGPDGRYTIQLDERARVLVFSYVGKEPREETIGSRTSIEVSLMDAAATTGEEIVVVAYGSQKRESITGSVSKIGADQLETRLTTNISQALAGAAPGISTTTGSGQPGSNAALRIRGFGSVNASSSPLYVVDGFPYEGFIGDLNTNDIESITLLKDASSTALYGARAANGVVMITTKKGKSGTPKFNLMVNTGFSERGVQEYDRVGAYDYYPVMWQSIKNSLMYPASGTPLSEAAASQQASNTVATQLRYNPFGVPDNQVVGTDGKLNPNARLQYDDFDWYGPMSQKGMRNEVAFNVSSKINKTDYFFSLNYLKDEGFIIKSDYERVTARMSLNSQVKDWLRTGVNLSGVFVNSNLTGVGGASFINAFVFARGMGPIYPVHAFTPTGEPILDDFGNQWYDFGRPPGAVLRPGGASPGRHVIYESLLNTRLDKRNSLIGRTFAEAKFLKHFTFTTNLGIDMNNVRTYRYQNPLVGDGVTAGGTAARVSNEFRTISLNQLLNYSQKFGNHSVSVLAGHETQRVDEDYFNGSRRGMNLDGNEELANFVTLEDADGRLDRLRRDAYLSRINYSYDNKYYLDLSYRRDASSRFSPKSRWGNFYSAGASWSVLRENFMSSTSGWLSDLKLR